MSANLPLDAKNDEKGSYLPFGKVFHEAPLNGALSPRDRLPLCAASERYMRNHMDLNVLEESKRFPGVSDRDGQTALSLAGIGELPILQVGHTAVSCPRMRPAPCCPKPERTPPCQDLPASLPPLCC